MAKQNPQHDQFAAQLAEIEENPSPAPDATISNLKAELDTMAGHLLGGKRKDQFEDESACARVTNLVEAIGQDPDDITIDTDMGSSAGQGNSDAPALGTIGQYEIITKLGEGGMGAVYKARHTKLDKIVAIKVLPAERMKDKGAVARFEREMRAVGKLEHPNIVRAMDAGEVDDMHFLVMEYVKGRDLSHLVREHGPLPIPEACELIRQAAVGLDEAFDNDMVHRDIKPSNLILAQRRRKPPVVKILDMGLALLSDAHSADAGLTTTGQMMGTLDYMAPEQGGDSKNVDIRADIYALGASLYRLLCGEVIYHGEKYSTPVQKMMALAVAPAPPIQERREGIPDELAAIVHRMLEKEPDARYATPQEIADDLAPFCAGADLGWLLTGQRSENTGPVDTSLSATELGASSSDVDTSVTTAQPGERGASAPWDESPSADPSAVTIAPVTTTDTAAKMQTSALRKIPKNLLIVGGAGLLGITALLAALVFFVQTPQGTLRVEIHDPEIEVKVKGSDIVLTGADKESITLKAGEHSLIVTRGDFTFETKNFVLKKGETTTVKVELLPGKVQVVSAGQVIGENLLPATGEGISSTNFALACDQKIEESHHVKIPSLTLKELPDPQQVCIEGYVRVRDAEAENRDLFGFAYEFTTRLHHKDRWKATAYLTDSAAQPIASVPIKFDEWVHVAAVRDGDELRLYVDGRKAASAKTAEDFDIRDRPFIVGSSELHADFDELRVSSSARYENDFSPSSRFKADEHTLALYHFDEGSGEILKDSSGNDHHGKIVGAKWVKVAPESKNVDHAIKFDGAKSYVHVPDIPVDASGPLTIECLATPHDASQIAAIVRLYGQPGCSIYHARETWGCSRFDEKGQHHRNSGVPQVGQRVHLAATWQGEEMSLFVDGKKSGTLKHLQHDPDRTRQSMFLGGQLDDQGESKPAWLWSGTLDEVRVSNVIRYDSDFAQPARHQADQHTVALYHCDEGSGDVLKDSSGNNHHGKIVGAKWVKLDTSGNAASTSAETADISKPASAITQTRHREAVELLLERKAAAVVLVDGQRVKITKPSEIPEKTFELRGALQASSIRMIPGSINDTDCKVLAGLGTIDELDLRGSEVTLTGLQEFSPTNQVLALSIPRHLKNNATVLPVFPKVRFVGVPHVEPNEFIAALRGNKSITAVSLWRTNVSEQSLAILAELPNLKYLVIEAKNSTTPTRVIDTLGDFPVLEHLSLDVATDTQHIKPSDLSPLKRLTTLKTLFVGAYKQQPEFDRYIKDTFPDCISVSQQDHGQRGNIRDRSINFDPKPLAESASASHPESGKHTSLVFGGRDFVEVSSLVDSGGPLTFEAYLTPGNNPTPYHHVFQFVSESEDLSLTLWDNSLYFRDTARTPNIPLEKGVRVHVSAVRDRDELRLFVDGKLVGSVSIAADKQTSGGKLRLGRYQNAFVGQMDEVRISKVARYDKDFFPAESFSGDSDTLALYHFDEGTGDVLKDSSGNNHHGKIVGAKWVKIEDSDVSSADRAAVNYVRSVGGKAWTKDNPYRLVSVNLLHCKDVTDDGLTVFRDCSHLQWLNLEWTAATDHALAHFLNCRELETIQIGPTTTDAALAYLPKFPELESVGIGARQGQISTAGLKHLRDCPKLTNARLWWNTVTDDSALEIANWPNLTSLSLLETKELTDKGLAHLKACKHLQYLRITKTAKLSDNMLDELKAALPECEVRIDRYKPRGDGYSPSADEDAPAIDLLTKVELPKNIVRGNWSLKDGTLTGTHDHKSEEKTSIIEFPVDVPQSYRLEIDFTRRAGQESLNVNLPVGEDSVTLIIDGFSDKRLTGLQQVDHKTLPNWESTIDTVKLTNGQRYQAVVDVAVEQSKANIEVLLDGQTILRWAGETNRLNTAGYHATENPQQIGLSVQFAEFQYHALKLSSPSLRREESGISAKDRSTRDSIAPTDDWVDLLTLIDPAKDTKLDDNFSDAAKTENGELVLGHRTSLALPIKISGSYQLRAEFTTWNGPKFLGLTCPIASSLPLLLLADGDNESGYQGAGLQTIDGRGARDAENPTHVKEPVLISDQKQTLALTVSSAGDQVTVKATVDGKLMFDWTGAATSLPALENDAPQKMTVSTYKGMLKFHSLQLKMLDGEAKLLRPQVRE